MYEMNTKSTFPIDIGFIDLLMSVNFDNNFDKGQLIWKANSTVFN